MGCKFYSRSISSVKCCETKKCEIFAFCCSNFTIFLLRGIFDVSKTTPKCSKCTDLLCRGECFSLKIGGGGEAAGYTFYSRPISSGKHCETKKCEIFLLAAVRISPTFLGGLERKIPKYSKCTGLLCRGEYFLRTSGGDGEAAGCKFSTRSISSLKYYETKKREIFAFCCSNFTNFLLRGIFDFSVRPAPLRLKYNFFFLFAAWRR